MIRVDCQRAAARVRAAGTVLLSIAVMLGLFILAIGAVVGERRR
ncbi:hypothetical protein [uncultured Sphingomonas sp.]|nr:hypothetical protein [uncultured Sphingomonas sp.]